MSDLIMCGVYFQCCFTAVWVLLCCFSFSSKVDESICAVRGLLFVFLHALVSSCVSLALETQLASHRWCIQEAQLNSIISTTVYGVPEKCDMPVT